MKRLALLATILVAFAVQAPSCLAAEAPRLSPAARTLAQCVQTNHQLAVLLLIDESGSLRTTDPLDQRIDGIRAALTGLADLAETPVSGRRPQVSVLMAGFYGIAHPSPGDDSVAAEWQTVDGSTVDSLNEQASQYADRNVGKATDYATALDTGHRLLVERAAELTSDGGSQPCKALIWFTDGRYSIPARAGEAGQGLPKRVFYAPHLNLEQRGTGLKAVAAGKALMCRPDGLLDSIADDGIVRFTVALSTQLSAEDGEFLDAATTGTAGTRSCGSRLSERTGEYLTASDGDRLFFAFGNLLISPPPVTETEVCPRLSCLHGTTSFATVTGLSSFLIRASSGIDGSVLELKGPDGKPVTLRPGETRRQLVSGAEIVQRWVSDRAVEVQGDFRPDADAWLGRWSFTFIDPSARGNRAPAPRSYNTVQLFSDLEPTLSEGATAIRGLPTEIELELTSGAHSNRVRSGPLLRRVSLSASIADPIAETTRRVPIRATGPGEYVATVLAPRSSSTSILYLGVTANLATADGTPIAPQFRSFSLPVRLPPGQGFPLLSPAKIELASVEGTGTAEGILTVAGSPVGGGCVWIGKPQIEAPEAAGQIAVSIDPAAQSPGECLAVEKGQSRQIRLRLTPAEAASGTVTASFPVHLHSDFVDGSRVTSVPVTFVLTTPPDNAARAALLAGLILLGALLPLALLYFLNRSGARFTAPQRLLFLAQDAVVSPAGLEVGTEPTFAAFEPLAPSGAGREARGMRVDRLKLRTVAARNLGDLFRGPYGVATDSEGGRIFAGGLSGRLRHWHDRVEHEVPLSISGTWFFLPASTTGGAMGTSWQDLDGEADPWGGDDGFEEDSADRVPGRLILLISRSGDVELGRELLSDASLALREADLEEKDRTEPQGSPPEGGESGLDAKPASTGTQASSSEADPWA